MHIHVQLYLHSSALNNFFFFRVNMYITTAVYNIYWKLKVKLTP